jgi:putative radical SAM enzyme (TIGR03279 family)
MMIPITKIKKNSIAEALDIKAGQTLITINGKKINDRLDYKFYAAEENLELVVEENGQQIIYDVEKDSDEELGLVLEDMKLKSCGNNCVFCFVHQNPKGMRKALYFKDEDYRYSFMYGHYVTLTTLKQSELQRIVEQKLSPLYISVHSTEEKSRKLLLGIKRDDQLLEKIKYLTANQIELHAQIVLVPQINDGENFNKTVEDLKKFYPYVRSVAVVPVGLTRFRKNLMPIRTHTQEELLAEIHKTEGLRAQLKLELGDSFIYLSDEFFIKAKQKLPSAEYYDAFYQIENGVGEFREMIDSFEENFGDIVHSLQRPKRITWVTGVLAYSNLKKYIIDPLNASTDIHINLIAVKNNFYGENIQISGLLTGQDIYEQLKNIELGEKVLLPPRVLNEDRLFLDNWTVEKLSEKLGANCRVFTEDLAQISSVVYHK